jgi:hypothetical protein
MWLLTYKELRRMLAEAGCTFAPGTGHEKVYFGDRQSSLPRHGKDIGPYLLNKILRDLGLKGLKK